MYVFIKKIYRHVILRYVSKPFKMRFGKPTFDKETKTSIDIYRKYMSNIGFRKGLKEAMNSLTNMDERIFFNKVASGQYVVQLINPTTTPAQYRIILRQKVGPDTFISYPSEIFQIC